MYTPHHEKLLPRCGFSLRFSYARSQPLLFSFICKYLSIRLFCCLLIDLPFSAKNISRLPLYFRFPSGSLPDFSPTQPPLNIRPCDHSLRFYGFFFHIRGNLRKTMTGRYSSHIRHPLCQDPLRSINGCRRKIRKNNCQNTRQYRRSAYFFIKSTISVLFS